MEEINKKIKKICRMFSILSGSQDGISKCSPFHNFQTFSSVPKYRKTVGDIETNGCRFNKFEKKI